MIINQIPGLLPQWVHDHIGRLILAALASIVVSTAAFAFLYWPDIEETIQEKRLALGGEHSSSNPLRELLVTAPINAVKSWISGPEVETIHLDIKFKHYRKLEQKREKAFEEGILITSDDDYVPAEIRYQGRTIKVKIRLKGDWLDHIAEDEWSFRVHVKGDDHVMGMRRFSLQHPMTRSYIIDPIFHRLLRRKGLLALRYELVDLVVNGKNLGLMALEEHFSKELLESQGRRESVILRFDESLVWAQTGTYRGFSGPYDSYATSHIKPFRAGRIEQSEKLSQELEVATGLMRGFVNSRLPASQVFDVELMARYLALCEVWGLDHAVRWHNIRFYYNPITARLEPIGFDAYRPQFEIKWTFHEEPLMQRVLSDPEMLVAFRSELTGLAQEVVSGDLLAFQDGIKDHLISILHRDAPLLLFTPFPALEAKARHLLRTSSIPLHGRQQRQVATELLKPESYPQLVHAYLARDAAGPYLEIRNLVPNLVEITAINWRGSIQTRPPTFKASVALPFPLELPATPVGGIPATVRIYYQQPDTATDNLDLEVVTHVQGYERSFTDVAVAYPSPLEANPIPQATQQQAVQAHPFLQTDRDGMRIAPGVWPVNSPIIVPPGMTLTIPAGVTLRFGQNTGIICRGPLHMEGLENAPVTLEPAPGTEAWQGVVVLQAAGTSRWSYSRIRGTSGMQQGKWRLTSGVTFYESNVAMDHVSLSGNRSEDALNIVRSEFALNDVFIQDTISDAFDSDFSNGEMTGGTFANIGGDGIDVSGSSIKVDGVRLLNVHDKALSVGEQSQMTASNIVIDGAGTGVASKDLSRTTISDSRLEHIRHIGLMAYSKKPEYGPGEIEAVGVHIDAKDQPALAQLGNRILIDGTAVKEEDVDIDELYKQGYMQK